MQRRVAFQILEFYRLWTARAPHRHRLKAEHVGDEAGNGSVDRTGQYDLVRTLARIVVNQQATGLKFETCRSQPRLNITGPVRLKRLGAVVALQGKIARHLNSLYLKWRLPDIGERHILLYFPCDGDFSPSQHAIAIEFNPIKDNVGRRQPRHRTEAGSPDWYARYRTGPVRNPQLRESLSGADRHKAQHDRAGLQGSQQMVGATVTEN